MILRAFLIVLLPFHAFAAENILPANAVLHMQITDDFAGIDIATGPRLQPGAPFDHIRVEGRINRRIYWVADNRSTAFQLMAPLKQSLNDQGYRVFLDCNTRQCGGFDFRFAINVTGPPDMVVNLGDFHYMSAEKDGNFTQILSSSAGLRSYIEVTEITAVQADIVPEVVASALGLSDALKANGRIVLDGVVFASGATELDDNPVESLRSLADFLQSNPAARMAIVGHTDSSGTAEVNLSLSKKRADSVIRRLVNTYGIEANRLESGAAGYFAPLGSNDTESGREMNRRVEAILLPRL